jgi:hypothetical protein
MEKAEPSLSGFSASKTLDSFRNRDSGSAMMALN